MKTIGLWLFLSIALAGTAIAADFSGNWTGSFNSGTGDNGSAYVILKQNGTTVTGSGGPDANDQWPGLEGTVSGNKVSFQVKSTADGTVYKCALVLDGDHLKGDVQFTAADGQAGNAKLDLTRVTK
jgi:hypothetical protein